jgi:ATP-dependent protease Clp ATPase subunit
MWRDRILAKPWFAGRLCCSFCRRGADDVDRLLAGASANAYICDSCVTQCVTILQDRGGLNLPACETLPTPVR